MLCEWRCLEGEIWVKVLSVTGIFLCWFLWIVSVWMIWYQFVYVLLIPRSNVTITLSLPLSFILVPYIHLYSRVGRKDVVSRGKNYGALCIFLLPCSPIFLPSPIIFLLHHSPFLLLTFLYFLFLKQKPALNYKSNKIILFSAAAPASSGRQEVQCSCVLSSLSLSEGITWLWATWETPALKELRTSSRVLALSSFDCRGMWNKYLRSVKSIQN